MAGIRAGLRMVAQRDSEWAGIPMPLEGRQLVIEPTYPRGQALAKIGSPVHAPHELDGAKIRNVFWSWRWRSRIVIWEHEGKIGWGKEPRANQMPMAIATIDGVVLPPSIFSIIFGCPPSMIATALFVVPKSIPIIFDIYFIRLIYNF